ncbi:hypothetical protein SK128_023882 [Halocaridina rubra]|uniref:Amino acid transporter transmembrane domain-containing protein n=1 Tax=Halocaridina rubra TaxID=373956 RepID=A0AAN8WR66_HALRR
MSVSSKSSGSVVDTVSKTIGTMEIETDPEAQTTKKGLGVGMTVFFLVAQMAGAGFLALPKAVANTGWLGLAMMILFCVMIGFSGTRLGHCWIILEERWPEYRVNCRQPYMEIAYRSFGKTFRTLTLISVLSVIIGGTMAFIILIGGFMNDLVPSVSVCEWILITCGVLLPFTWLGTPKDFWQV